LPTQLQKRRFLLPFLVEQHPTPSSHVLCVFQQWVNDSYFFFSVCVRVRSAFQVLEQRLLHFSFFKAPLFLTCHCLFFYFSARGFCVFFCRSKVSSVCSRFLCIESDFCADRCCRCENSFLFFFTLKNTQCVPLSFCVFLAIICRFCLSFSSETHFVFPSV
jgi:hypothetical protein